MNIQLTTIAVIGAGTMGQGIAQVAAAAGHNTLLFDVAGAALEKGMNGIRQNLDTAVRKGALLQESMNLQLARITPVYSENEIVADLVIEAVVEKIEIKQALFGAVEKINDGRAILATNTSSLSVTEIAKGLADPTRLLGMHFFNPAHRMKLVEIIAGQETDPRLMAIAESFLIQAGKTVVRSADHPGFIVNRVARHFYLESLRLLEQDIAGPAVVDALLRSAGFKMGPFELMDLIGIDINYAVSESVYNAFDHAVRFKPSDIQRQKVDAGMLGRKNGQGFYSY